jgi:hypothetical protein
MKPGARSQKPEEKTRHSRSPLFYWLLASGPWLVRHRWPILRLAIAIALLGVALADNPARMVRMQLAGMPSYDYFGEADRLRMENRLDDALVVIDEGIAHAPTEIAQPLLSEREQIVAGMKSSKSAPTIESSEAFARYVAGDEGARLVASGEISREALIAATRKGDRGMAWLRSGNARFFRPHPLIRLSNAIDKGNGSKLLNHVVQDYLDPLGMWIILLLAGWVCFELCVLWTRLQARSSVIAPSIPTIAPTRT